jgi:hypothetical protein
MSLDREALLRLPALAPPLGVQANFINPYTTVRASNVRNVVIVAISTPLVWTRIFTKCRVVRRVDIEDCKDSQTRGRGPPGLHAKTVSLDLITLAWVRLCSLNQERPELTRLQGYPDCWDDGSSISGSASNQTRRAPVGYDSCRAH